MSTIASVSLFWNEERRVRLSFLPRAANKWSYHWDLVSHDQAGGLLSTSC